MKVVLDTNILVSRVIAPSGKPATVMRAWREEKSMLIVSPAILDECRRVLTYPRIRKRHNLTDTEMGAYATLIEEFAGLVHPQER